MVKERSFKDTISIISSGGHFIKQSREVCAIVEEGIMINISENIFQI